ncbi:MAG: hypothetical protein K2W99_02545 [Chthoniobacterales bacterium]|nr:hypothetical protein [Chthoniobacterales bacterium]
MNLLRHTNDVSPNKNTSNTSWFNPLACCSDVKDDSSHESEGRNRVGSFHEHQVREVEPQYGREENKSVGSLFEHKTTKEESDRHYKVLLAARDVLHEAHGLFKSKLEEIKNIKEELDNTSENDRRAKLENLLQLTCTQVSKIGSYRDWAKRRYNWLLAKDVITQDALKDAKPYESRQWSLQEIKDDWEVTKEDLLKQNDNALSPQVKPVAYTESKSKKKLTFSSLKQVNYFDQKEADFKINTEEVEVVDMDEYFRDVPSLPFSPTNTPSENND